MGGAERVLLDVMESLQPVLPNGSTMRLICLSEGDFVQAAVKAGIEAQAIPLPERLSALGESGGSGGKLRRSAKIAGTLLLGAPQGIAHLRRLRAEVSALDPDIIHSNGIKAHLLSRLLPRGRGAIVWQVQDFVGARPLMAGWLRYAAGHTARAVGLSQAVGNDLRGVLPRTPVDVVLHGIDTQHFTPEGEHSDLDRLAGLPAGDDVVRVGLLGTYARWKGHEVFIRAASILRNRGVRNIRFYIIGGSIYHTAGSQYSRDELKRIVEQSQLSDVFGFVDFQPDTVGIYRALDVVVHASTKPEPFGRTIVESMACGRATIVSAAGGAAELFTPDVDAIGVSPGDANGLADAIERLAADAGTRQRLGFAARAASVARFDRKRIGPEMMEVYRRALSC